MAISSAAALHFAQLAAADLAREPVCLLARPPPGLEESKAVNTAAMAISSLALRLAQLMEADLARKSFGLFARPPPGLEELLEDPQRAPTGRCSEWPALAECDQDGHEFELAQFDSAREPAPRKIIPVAGLFVDGSAAPPAAEVASARAEAAARPAPPKPAAAPAAEAASASAEAAAGPAPPKQAPQLVTTLMVQNLGRGLTRHGFMLFLDRQGFGGKYDYVYLPTSIGTRRNNGFAFVNFMKPEDAEEFAHSIARIKGSKMRAVPADVQGLEANAWKASTRQVTRVRNSASRPWVVGGHSEGATSHA